MNIKELFILSFESLWDRKIRSILTILMVKVGGALLIAINGIALGFSASFNKQFINLAHNIFYLYYLPVWRWRFTKNYFKFCN